jgi:hypothetical protein
VYRNPDRSAYVPSQIPSTPISNSHPISSTSTDEPQLLLDVDVVQTPSPSSHTHRTPNITPPVTFTPTTIRSSNSTMKPTRRKSTPASLNKSYTHSHDSLFVHVPLNSLSISLSTESSSPTKPLAGSVPKDFFSPTRHSAGGKLKSQSVSVSSPLVSGKGGGGSLRKIFASESQQERTDQGEGEAEEEEEEERVKVGEKSGLAMALEFDD